MYKRLTSFRLNLYLFNEISLRESKRERKRESEREIVRVMEKGERDIGRREREGKRGEKDEERIGESEREIT